MEKLLFDTGVKEYRLGVGGVLRFNPGDPNLYARFLEAAEKISQIEEDMIRSAKAENCEDTGTAILKLLQEADQKMKQTLNWVFGHENDFDKLLGGVNLLAVGANGKRVVSNLFDALQPILLEGAQSCAREKTQEAVKQAKARRSKQ